MVSACERSAGERSFGIRCEMRTGPLGSPAAASRETALR